MLTAIARPFGILMLWLYQLTGNYGLAIILFGLIVNVILLPFMMKSKKSMMHTTRLQPRIKELQKRHEGNQQKLNAEIQKLYREEKANPMSGCLWSLLPFPILIALYQAIRMPLTTMMGIPSALLAEGGTIIEKLNSLGFSAAEYTGQQAAYIEIYQSKFITEHFDAFAGLSDKLVKMDYSFLGLDISVTPSWKFWEFDWGNSQILVPALLLFSIPLISTLLSYLSMAITNKLNKNTGTGGANDQAQAMNKSMLMFMPLMSLWIGFIMPAALGIYWIVNSTVGILREVVLTSIYSKKMDILDAERLERERIRDEEIERKRIETERLRALNATSQSKNTSRKKLQASQKQEEEERRAAARREERRARRERLGIADADIPDSQVGNRRYARGRAYVDDRFTNPEGAEAATLLAAEESLMGESIDETIADDVVVPSSRDSHDDEAAALADSDAYFDELAAEADEIIDSELDDYAEQDYNEDEEPKEDAK